MHQCSCVAVDTVFAPTKKLVPPAGLEPAPIALRGRRAAANTSEGWSRRLELNQRLGRLRSGSVAVTSAAWSG